MAEFLDVAELLWRRGEVQVGREDFERVFTTLARLYVVHSKAELDLTNIESAFATLEMARTLSRLPGTSEDQISAVISSLKRVIAKTIELTLRLPTSEERGVLPPPPYGSFAELVSHLLRDAYPNQTVAVLTFNYDLALDYACFTSGLPINYGLEDDHLGRGLPVLKLHGSLNWGICTRCRKIIPWSLPSFFESNNWGHPRYLPKTVALDIGTHLAGQKHCDMLIEPEPVLVPPTWNKGEYHSSLSRVWARAGTELSEAENIFICGYSLPDTDAFFRYLYALGTEGDSPLKRLWVCNPDRSVESRFEAMLGPGARRRFQYRPESFEEAIRTLRNEFPGRG